ncbi:phage/plasmid replication protein, II/X family, partial [Xanthomonas euvesicatoria]
MIDWLSMIVPCSHPTPITGGHVLSLTPDGEVSWRSSKRSTVEGSFGTGLQIRTCTHTADPCTHLEISGNPVKFFQGHNLWGTDDLPSLAIATFNHLIGVLSLNPTDTDRALVRAGMIQLTRVDVTESFHLESRAQVLAWLRAAEQTAHLSHRGRGQLVKGTTLYFGKNSRRWGLKLYSKGQEIHAKGHGQDAILSLPHAVAWADRTLRAELTIRSMELKRMGRSMVSDWFSDDGLPCDVTRELLRERLQGMTMTTTAHLSAEILSTFRPSLRLAYQSWEAGTDLRS